MTTTPTPPDSISFALGEIKGQLNQLVSQLGIQDTRYTTMISDLNTRVTKVENRQHWYAGAAAAVSALVTWFANKGFHL